MSGAPATLKLLTTLSFRVENRYTNCRCYTWWAPKGSTRYGDLLHGKAQVRHLCFAQAGGGDLHRRIAGVRTSEHREAVKKAVNAFLFGKAQCSACRGASRICCPPKLQSVPTLRVAIVRAHPARNGALDTALGYRLMNTESSIMVAVLMQLNGMGITALPLHDGLMVAEGDARTAEGIMQEVAEEMTGCRLPVSLKAR